MGLTRGDPDTLDPTVSRSTASLAVYPAMCQQLYDRDSNQQLVPVLAAAVPVLSKDKLSYTIQLRQGIQFNDGTPFNAQAVVTTIQWFMNYPGSVRVGDYASVDGVTASGPYTVVFHLKARDSTFIGGNSYILSPAQLDKLGANFGTKPICVGPFMFDHRVPGDNVTLIKSPYYYDQKDVYLDKVVYGGEEQVSCTPIPPANTAWFDATKVPCTPYDPKDARKLVATSGFPNPTVHLTFNNTTDNVGKAQFIQAQEAAVGINVVLDPAESATVTSREVSGNFETCLGGAVPGSPDPSGNVYPWLASTGVRNFSGYSTPRLDLILDNAQKATSIRARSTLYHVAQQIIQEERPFIVLYNPTTFTAFRANLAGVHLSASGVMRVENARYR